MDKMRIIEVKQSVFADNDADAEKLRQSLKEEKTFLLNLMSSPGSGKTSTLVHTIQNLSKDLKIGVMEADIDSDVDAWTIAEKTGVKTIQLQNVCKVHDIILPSYLILYIVSQISMMFNEIAQAR